MGRSKQCSWIESLTVVSPFLYMFRPPNERTPLYRFHLLKTAASKGAFGVSGSLSSVRFLGGRAKPSPWAGAPPVLSLPLRHRDLSIVKNASARSVSHEHRKLKKAFPISLRTAVNHKATDQVKLNYFLLSIQFPRIGRL